MFESVELFRTMCPTANWHQHVGSTVDQYGTRQRNRYSSVSEFPFITQTILSYYYLVVSNRCRQAAHNGIYRRSQPWQCGRLVCSVNERHSVKHSVEVSSIIITSVQSLTYCFELAVRTGIGYIVLFWTVWMSRQQSLHSKSVKHLVQWSLCDPQALGNDLAVLGTLQPQALGSLNCIDTLDSASSYYIYGMKVLGGYTVNREIFAVKIFSQSVLATKIKHPKIKRIHIR